MRPTRLIFLLFLFLDRPPRRPPSPVTVAFVGVAHIHDAGVSSAC